MDWFRDYHTKWIKANRERQIPYDIAYMWNLKYDTNELIYETETDHRHINQTYIYQRGKAGGEGLIRSLGLEYLTFCNLIDCSPPASSVHGIFQARILEWVTISYSRISSWPRIKPPPPELAGGFFITSPSGKPVMYTHCYSLVAQW